jgi:hypothetical protein
MSWNGYFTDTVDHVIVMADYLYKFQVNCLHCCPTFLLVSAKTARINVTSEQIRGAAVTTDVHSYKDTPHCKNC